jgi:hypothetical protein
VVGKFALARDSAPAVHSTGVNLLPPEMKR